MKSAGRRPAAALTAVENLDVQFVVIANTALDGTTGAPDGAIGQLAAHVVGVSNTGGDGKERMGVAMLAKGATDADGRRRHARRRPHGLHRPQERPGRGRRRGGHDRRVRAAHLDAAQAGVDRQRASSRPAEIDAINGSETFDSGPAGKGVNWLVDPSLIAGGGTFLGEGYTGNPGGKKFIDVQRTVDDCAFKLKARLIRSIGNLRISRSGLRSLVVQMEAVLDPLVAGGVIEGYEIVIPVLDLLDADPASLTAAQLQVIKDAQADRVVEVLVAVDYAGAIHRIAITLKFE